MARFFTFIAAAPLALAAPAFAQEAISQVDYAGFAALTAELSDFRSERLLDREAYFEGARTEGALLLDTRSAAAFNAGHIEGAVNLPFSDFTEAKLRAIVGENVDRPIYIYCNNNFSDNIAPVVLKRAPLALNIPTFINLVGYGYTNVWELGETIPMAEANWVEGD